MTSRSGLRRLEPAVVNNSGKKDKNKRNSNSNKNGNHKGYNHSNNGNVGSGDSDKNCFGGAGCIIVVSHIKTHYVLNPPSS